MTKKYIAYTRVSTQKQCIEGVSLQEQRRFITNYAHHNQLNVATWHEETITAGKSGRPLFTEVIQRLRADEGYPKPDIALEHLVAVLGRPDDVIAVVENAVAAGGILHVDTFRKMSLRPRLRLIFLKVSTYDL